MQGEHFIPNSLKSVKEIVTRDREVYFKLSQQADKIIVWLVGFSVAAIGIVVNNAGKDNEVIKEISFNLVWFATATIFFGILYRITSYLFQNLEAKILNGFYFFIEGYIHPETYTFGREITLQDSVSDILEFIKEDFNITINLSDIEKPYKIKDLVQISNDKKFLENKYYELEENLENEKIEELSDILSKQLGISKKRFKKSLDDNSNKTKWVWILLKTTSIMFILTNLTFLTGIIFIVYKYLTFH